MIKVDSIDIEEFRGIRKLKLDFNKENFAVCGPNGTGKSGVIDALEFVLTGSISRLTGEGRGEVSLRKHGPHVDKQNDPEKARVTIEVTIPGINKTATIERNLKSPAFYKITPNDPDVIKALVEVQAHPELVLSRRELIKYVLATPGKRNEEVQVLLHLDKIEDVRGILLKLKNSCEKEFGSFEVSTRSAADNLSRSLGITGLPKSKVLEVVNNHRTILGLSNLTDLTATTSLKDGLATPSPTQPQRIPKTHALSDIQAARETVEEILGPETKKKVDEVTALFQELITTSAGFTRGQMENFFSIGLDLLDSDECPFCNKPWEIDELKAHLKTKLDKLKELTKKRKVIEGKNSPLTTLVSKARSTVQSLVGYSSLMKTPLKTAAEGKRFMESCKSLNDGLGVQPDYEDAVALLNQIQDLPGKVSEYITELETYVSSLPEPTKQDASKEFITVAQERLEVWREAMRNLAAAKENSLKAAKVHDTYVTTSDKFLTDIYSAVEKDFSNLYRFINREDEDKFKAQLTPSKGKLGFDVDFYGRGYFPPGAYHSEGHQDSMGLCLYLALMRHLQGENFTFSVLDDVLMSVDAGHRREVCALLKKEFPNTQFIMTTHDPVWLRHMKTEGLTKNRSAVHFRNWDVDNGPTRWDDLDVWTELKGYLENNQIREAAGRLRNYLEYISKELCHRLRAPVEFREDAQYQLGELLPSAIKHFRKLLGAGKEAANSWDQREEVAALAEKEKSFNALALASKAEEWQMNASIHYNNWENLVKNDFEPVVKAFKELIEGFDCPHCKLFMKVLPERDTHEMLVCECGKTSIKLIKKPKP